MNQMGYCRKVIFARLGRRQGWLAPAASAACIITRKAFFDQYTAQALAAARQYAQFAAIAILIAVDALQAEGASIDKLV